MYKNSVLRRKEIEGQYTHVRNIIHLCVLTFPSKLSHLCSVWMDSRSTIILALLKKVPLYSWNCFIKCFFFLLSWQLSKFPLSNMISCCLIKWSVCVKCLISVQCLCYDFHFLACRPILYQLSQRTGRENT